MTEHAPTEEAVDTVVIGAGLAGLVAATTAAGTGGRVVLLDAHTPGGRARTDRRGDFVFNRGPRALYREGAASRILGELGVRTDRGGVPKGASTRGLLHGRVVPFPHGPAALLRTPWLSAGEKVRFGRAFVEITRRDPARFRGVSVDEAIQRLTLGPMGAEAVRAVVRLATYSDDTDVHDAEAAFRQVRSGAGPGVVYLDGGWQSLVDGLLDVARSRRVEVRTGARVESVRPAGVGGTVVTLADGSTITSRTAIVATGVPNATAELCGTSRLDATSLGPPVAAACLELGVRRPPTSPLLLGIDQPVYLSMHAPPADLAPDGAAVVHVVRYLRHDEEIEHRTVREQLRTVAATAGIHRDDIVEERFLAHMTVAGGTPTGPHGATGRPEVLDPTRPGILFAGDWVGPDGLLVDAAVASAASAGRSAADRSAVLSPT